MMFTYPNSCHSYHHLEWTRHVITVYYCIITNNILSYVCNVLYYCILLSCKFL